MRELYFFLNRLTGYMVILGLLGGYIRVRLRARDRVRVRERVGRSSNVTLVHNDEP